MKTSIANLEGHPELSIMFEGEAHLFLLFRRNELPLRTLVTPSTNPLCLIAPRVSDADKRDFTRNPRCLNFTELKAGDGVSVATNQTIVAACLHLIGVWLQGKQKNVSPLYEKYENHDPENYIKKHPLMNDFRDSRLMMYIKSA